jgi:exo-beta-1,3-glucanase (GH17 family)
MPPSELVNCINSVKSDLNDINLGSLKVGTADSWNLWVNASNFDVIQACDILLSNAFSVIIQRLD